MNITPINFVPSKELSGMDEFSLSSEERYLKIDKTTDPKRFEKFEKKNYFYSSPTEKADIRARIESIQAQINAIKKDTEALIQKKRDTQQKIRMEAKKAITSEEDKIFEIKMAAKRQISDLELELMILGAQL